MIYIVLKHSSIHSVWTNKAEADNQIEVLINRGVKDDLHVEEIEGEIPVNGQYYI